MLKNVGSLDRIARVVLGLALLAAVWLGAIGNWGWLGLLPLATGLLGLCPAYLPFGLNTCASKLKRVER